MIIAGTGAVAYGRNAEGVTHKEDGFGYLLGDRGSGFNLGLYALRYTLDSMQQDRSDALTVAVLAHTGARIQNEILQWLYGEFSPARVASLAPIVGELAESGVPPPVRWSPRWPVVCGTPCGRSVMRSGCPAMRPSILWADCGSSALSSAQSLPNRRGPVDAEMPLEPDTLPGGRFTLAEPKHDAAVGAALLAAAAEIIAQVA